MARPRSKPRTESAAGATPFARGERIRRLRESLGLSREEFGNQFGIPSGSMQNWEDARYDGLSKVSANKLINAFRKSGIEVTLEWLFYGEGDNPLSLSPNQIPSASFSATEEALIAQELRLFHQHNIETTDMIVADSSMVPAFLPGDWVAGKRYFEKDIERAIHHACIVQTLDGQILLRIIKSSQQEGFYDLLTLNSESVVKNMKLFSAAPVLWMRRKSLK